MVQRKSIKILPAAVSFVVLINLCMIIIHVADAPSYIVRYFIGPILAYIPFSFVLIAIVTYNLNTYIIKSKHFKILTVVLTCIIILYYIVCFSLIGYYNIRNHDKLSDIKNIPQQAVNNIFFENIKDITIGNAQDTSYTWNDSLLIEYSNDYKIEQEEITDSIYVDMYCFDNFMFSEKIKNKINNTYFHSEYAYSIANTEFDDSDVIVGETNDVSFQYCYVTTTNNGKLNQSTYFTVLLEDDNSVFLISIIANQKERTIIDVTKEIDYIIELTNRLWAD